ASDDAAHLQDVLATHSLAGAEGGWRAAGVENDLRLAGAVPQVDENHTAHIPATVDPAGEDNFFAHIFHPQFTARVRLQHGDPSLQFMIAKQMKEDSINGRGE